MEKVRYEIDPHNRLVEGNAGIEGIRQALDGRFRVDKNNELVYQVKSPLPYSAKKSHQIKLKGNWRLTSGHDLLFTLNKWKRQSFGDELLIQGEIIDVQKNALVFGVTTRSKDGSSSAYLLSLSGVWQADAANRLTFKVEKGNKGFDLLAFEGSWEVGKNYQLIYRYRKEQLATKEKVKQEIIFKGYWDIKDKYRLSYVLDKESNSGFDFKAGLGVFKEDYIKYELGIGVSPRPVKNTVMLFSKWNFKKGSGLIFEVQAGKRKIQEISFGAEARLTDEDTISFKLKDSLSRDLGVELELAHSMFKDSDRVFLKLLKEHGRASILIGAGLRW